MEELQKLKTDMVKWDRDYWVVCTIKAKRNDHNEGVIRQFKLFCKNETDNDYTQGLKRLLEHYSTDWKYESLYNEISELKTDIAEIKISKDQEVQTRKDKKENGGTF